MRVLLVEEGWHATLPVASALDRAGHEVTVLTANGTTAAHRRGGVRWRSGPTLDSSDFVAHVAAMAPQFDRIVPLTEAAMQQLWELPGIFPRTAVWQRRLVADKHALIEHMQARGVAIPRHRRVDERFDVDGALHELGLPVVVKSSIGCGGRFVRIADTRDAVVDMLARAGRLGGEWIVQEHVASPTYLVGGVFADGEPLRLYACEKLAQNPARIGAAVHVRSTRERALLELGERVVRELAWTGFASVDAVRRADGTFLLLEINPRPWGSLAGARAAGVDLFAPFVRLLAGETPPAELAFRDRVESWIFPKYLESAAHRGVRSVLRGLRDLWGEQGRDWRDPRFALYALRRVRRMRRLATRL